MRKGKSKKRQNTGRQAFFISAKPKKPKGKRGTSIGTIWANKRDDGSEFLSISWFTRDRQQREVGPHEIDPDRYFYNVIAIEPDEDEEDDTDEEDTDEDEEVEEDEDEEDEPPKRRKRKQEAKGAKKSKARGADDDLLDGLDEDEDAEDDE